MSYIPAIPVETLTWRQYAVTTLSSTSAAYRLGLQTGTTVASQAWPLANLAMFVPIYFNEFCTIYEVGVGTGATAGGNFDIGLYDMAGNKIQTTGTTARTASAWNS